MQTDVIHHANVLGISGDSVTLRLDDNCRQACGGCRLKAVCGTSGGAGAVVTVRAASGSDRVSAGDRVEAAVSAASQRMAIVVQLAVPLVLLIGAVVSLTACGADSLGAGAAGLGVVALWQVVLRVLGPRLDARVKWSIRKL